MSKEALHAADVPDRQFLQIVADKVAANGWGTAMRMQVEAELPTVPWKVLLAKARKLIRRGLLDGCSCGCRGDYSLTDAGRELLDSPSWRCEECHYRHTFAQCPRCGNRTIERVPS